MSVPSSASRPGNGPARPSVSWMSARCSPTSPQEGAGHRLLHRRLLLNLQEGWWRPFSPGGACPGGSFASPTEITVGTKVATTQLNAPRPHLDLG